VRPHSKANACCSGVGRQTEGYRPDSQIDQTGLVQKLESQIVYQTLIILPIKVARNGGVQT
jgi:hypothetical protein